MRKMKLFFTVLAVLISSAAIAQNITVTGSVKDSSTDEFVPFASIQLKGTMTGASTDADGLFTMTVPSDGILLFSSLGYHSREWYPSEENSRIPSDGTVIVNKPSASVLAPVMVPFS